MSKHESLPPVLTVLMNGRTIGRIERAGNRLTFIYEETWRQASDSFPLSLSMPLTASEHGHDAINNWISGLLPDNDKIIARLAKNHDVSRTSPYALIWKIGEDCPGATQFVEPENLESLTQGGDVAWLTEDDVADRLAELRRGGVDRRHNEGNFSLAGAQPKTALILRDGRWGVPSGRLPTTHILKPPIEDLDGHAENEVFCLNLASKLGLSSAEAKVLRFRDEVAITVTRYDRVLRGERIIRIHQEDLCQSLSIPPDNKYERDGGPGIKAIMAQLALSSSPESDRRRFMEAIALNFLIYGSDAHAKNYSILFAPGAPWQMRLAPLYDVASYLPYVGKRPQDVRMPMKIGDHRYYDDILPRHWERAARGCGYPPEEAVDQVLRLAEALPQAASEVAGDLEESGLDHAIIGTLVDLLSRRSDAVLKSWQAD